MRVVRAVNTTRQVALAEKVAVADSFLRRGWGLLGHPQLRLGEGMLITGTNCVHSMFMRFSFDAVYIDGDGRVCAIARCLRPFRFGPLVGITRHVLELPAGTVDRTATRLGDAVAFEDV